MPHSQKNSKGRRFRLLVVAAVVFWFAFVNRRQQDGTGLRILQTSSRDGRRVLRSSAAQFDNEWTPADTSREVSSSSSNILTSSSSSSSSNGGDGVLRSAAATSSGSRLPSAVDQPLDRQNSMVAAALDHVQRVADQDESLQWNDDPATQAARDAALAEMMGLQSKSDGPTFVTRDHTLARARLSRDMVEAIRGCRSLECIKIAHTRPPGRAKYNFPHFMMIGWQKTATTSLFAHLNQHPDISRPWDKEPEFFSETCNYDVPAGCPPNATADYITRVLRAQRYTGYDGQMAVYEASTHYSRNGHLLAAGVAAVFPWVKIVASLREPVSRAASMLVHLVDKNVTGGGCLARTGMDMGHCLLTESHISGARWGGATEYFMPLKAWVDAFPREQVFLVQYENLTSEASQRAELVRLKRFLDIDPHMPAPPHATLALHNSRRGRINPDGWPIKREVYEEILSVVRPDCEAVAKLVSRKGFGDGAAWLANWEKVWNDNLATCDKNGQCIMQLS